MNMKAKKLVTACVTAGAVFGLVGTPTIAKADWDWGVSQKTPFNAICQSSPAGSAYQACETGTTDGSPINPLVPKSTKKNTCFFLTDFTAYNNNPIAGGGRQVDLRDGNGGSRAFAAKVVYFLPYPSGGGNGGSTTVQDFTTPLVFTDNLYPDVHNPNNNVFITVSGYYDRCPGKKYY